jgi:hypothetical protein
MDFYITKPFSPSQLEDVLSGIILRELQRSLVLDETPGITGFSNNNQEADIGQSIRDFNDYLVASINLKGEQIKRVVAVAVKGFSYNLV